jgi:putative nucleotidyltransferase with HDIG domain
MLENISNERIRDELNKMIMSDNPDKALRILSLTGLNKYVIPELDNCKGIDQNEFHSNDVFDHILKVVKDTPPDLIARLSAIFHDIGKPQTKTIENEKVHFFGHEDAGAQVAKDVLFRLKYPNDEINKISNIVKNHMRLKIAGPDGENITDKGLRKFIATMGNDLDSALKMMQADNISHSKFGAMPNQITKIKNRIHTLQQTASTKPQLPVNGFDIMQHLNIKSGPIIKQLLKKVEDEWFENPNLDKNSALNIIKAEYDTMSQQSLASSLSTKNASNADIYIQTVKNPKTDNDILVKSALSYNKLEPVYQLAVNKLNKK